MIIQLKQQLLSILPLLKENRDLAYKEWMAGDIPRGSFEYVQQRYDIAIQILEKKELSVQQAFDACAMITIDLRYIVTEKPQEKSKLDSWLQCYCEAGYTDSHILFNFPIKSKMAVG